MGNLALGVLAEILGAHGAGLQRVLEGDAGRLRQLSRALLLGRVEVGLDDFDLGLAWSRAQP